MLDMEHFPIRQTDSGLHIDGVPDAVKAIRLEGPKARRLSHLFLHQADLNFVLDCLAEINNVENWTLKTALWHSAIVRFIKCFVSNGARSSRLIETKIYTNKRGAREAFGFFKKLRDKHIVHDENSFSQCIPCAAINGGNKSYKVEKILALSVLGQSLDQATYQNLHALASDAITWVNKQIDELFNLLTTELEAESYSALIARDAVTLDGPSLGDIGSRRKN
jgi:hypothetical protein